jgi:protein-S-isoprenylcysteine O-methyltransferase Ste14
LNWNPWIRQVHRWLSIAFTAPVLVCFVGVPLSSPFGCSTCRCCRSSCSCLPASTCLCSHISRSGVDQLESQAKRVSALRHLRNSLVHNIGVLAVGAIFACVGMSVDALLRLRRFRSPITVTLGGLLTAIGFAVRLWATYDFYERKLKVVSLQPQRTLIMTGAYAYSRNPLYLGGNVFIFLGGALIAGSPGGVLMTILNVLLLDRWMIPREEHQLQRRFGDAWLSYSQRVRRWL